LSGVRRRVREFQWLCVDRFFTSHVTGNVGRLANDAATGQFSAALTALGLVMAFFLGAFCASSIIESRFAGGATSRSYALALAVEASLLFLFTWVSCRSPLLPQTEQAAVLCAAMGMQNALVTRLSGAVVRTTHLTGVITDLGIECARWFRYSRRVLSEATNLRLVLGRRGAERPLPAKIWLLGTIAVTFLFGAVAGALSALHLQQLAMLLAALGVASCSLYARFNERLARTSREQSRFDRE